MGLREMAAVGRKEPRRTLLSGVKLGPFSLILMCLVFMVPVSESHVGLTFPPARKYDLDFLDNIRTKPPCGMPKGKQPIKQNSTGVLPYKY